jgi:hypothetical protein
MYTQVGITMNETEAARKIVRRKWRALLGLPLGWLGALAAACWANAPGELVFYGAVIGAITCYVVGLHFFRAPCFQCGRSTELRVFSRRGVYCEFCTAPEKRRSSVFVIAKHAVGLLAVLFGSGLFAVIILLARMSAFAPWDPIGNASGVSSTCQLDDLAPIRNRRGDVAVLRSAGCPGIFEQGIGFYMVFVHRVGEANNRQNLVFQYTPGSLSGLSGDFTSAPLPSVKWMSDSSLKIATKGQLLEIVKQRNHIDGIEIRYAFGKGPVGPRDTGYGDE